MQLRESPMAGEIPLHLVRKKSDVPVVPEKMLGRTFTQNSRW